MSDLVQTGYALAKAATRHHSKSFYFASIALFGARRRAAFALYAFCRRLDDIVDGDDGGPPQELGVRLDRARDTVRSLYGGPSTGGWHEAEYAALHHAVNRYQIPEGPFHELINGMEMDLTKSRYANAAELDLYCYRVAGVVGLLMTPILGYADAAALPYADTLGRAMQLTNILRDVGEDWRRGRVYLPADALAAHGISEADLATGRVTPAWREFMREQITHARALYVKAQLGIPMLQGFGSQRVVRLMSTIYGGILGAIEAQDFDVFSKRAHVPLRRKLVLASSVFLTPNPRPALPSGLAGATP